MLEPLNWHTAVATWRLAPVWDAIVILFAACYVYGALRYRARRGEAWPYERIVAFLAACAVLVVTVNGSIEVYGHMLFSLHMVQHLLLIMIVPALAVAGRPLELVVSASGEQTASRVRAILHCRPVAVVTHPVFGLAAYTVVLVGTHLTSFMQVMLTHMWAHESEKVIYLLAGYLFFLPLLAKEPIRWTLSYPLRLVMLFVGMTADTIVGVVLIQSTRNPFPAYAAMHRSWGFSPLEDIQWGGGIMWVGGDGLMFALIVIVMIVWLSRGEAGAGAWLEAARRDALGAVGSAGGQVHGDHRRPLGEGESVDDDDAALADYNAMLADMAGERRTGRPDS